MKNLVTPLILIAGLFAVVAMMTDMFPYAVTGRDDQMRLVVLGFLLGAMLISLISRIPMIARSAARHLSVCLAAVFGVLVAYNYRDEGPQIYERIRAAISPSVAVALSKDAVELRRGWDGHYHAYADVNGSEVAFLFDTGASVVVLRYEDAEKIGFDMDEIEFSVRAVTANGEGYVAPIEIDHLQLATVEVHDIKAFVTQPGKLNQSLLGMNFFNRLEAMTFQNNRVVLRQ